MGFSAPRHAVLTGAPGAGKSTLLQALGAKGLVTSPEVARTLLRAPGGMEQRMSDPVGFAWAMLDAQKTTYAMTGTAIAGPVVFDRGFADIVAFLALGGLPVMPELEVACQTLRFDGPIFRAPPWREIFFQDDERVQTWEEAQASDAAVCAAWRRYGYDLIDLPLAPVEQRTAFVLERLAFG